MRGKNTILKATVALFIGLLAISGVSVPRAFAQFPTVYVDPSNISGPVGYAFSVDICVSDVEFLRAFEFTLSWNQRVLKVVPPPEEGWFLPMGGNTFFVYAVGIAGESITVADLIVDVGKVDGSGVLATIDFQVIGGGSTDLLLSGRLLDKNFIDIEPVDWFGAFFGSTYPFIDFKWFMPTLQPDGSIENIESGTMFYGDEIIFDASGSFDPDGTIVSYEWTIREGGVDSFKGVNTKYTFTGPVVSWVPPWRSNVYGWFLGWTDLTLKVTDDDGNEAIYYTWIRVFRLVPARTIMENVGSRRHSLAADGPSKTLWGKVQNRGGTGWWSYETHAVYLELSRIVHGFIWARMQFTVKDMTGETVAVLNSNPEWLDMEQDSGPLSAIWDLTDVDPGYYMIYGKGKYCGSGSEFAAAATGTAAKLVAIDQ